MIFCRFKSDFRFFFFCFCFVCFLFCFSNLYTFCYSLVLESPLIFDFPIFFVEPQYHPCRMTDISNHFIWSSSFSSRWTDNFKSWPVTSRSHRAAEEAFIKERDEVTPGQEWERIARVCDFNPKNNKNLKDVTRFRSILLHLKQSGLQQPNK